MHSKKEILSEFQQIPGVGKTIARDLYNLDLRSIKDLKNQNPEDLYTQLCAYQNTQEDRCMLYVFRCAVYYASHANHDPHLLKWWNWKNR